MSTLIINTTSIKDLNLLLELAKRLNLTAKVIKEEKNRYNAETEKVIKEARSGKGLIKAKNVEDLMKQLNS
jgi:antitoxin component of RelBE/YafQ-DinJ toxin-antitoxin module